MKKDMFIFKRTVEKIRSEMPSYNHGRIVKVYHEYTKQGRKILDMVSKYDAAYLYQVYSRPSQEKQRIFDACYEMYVNDFESSGFGICSHNGYGFTVSWIARNERYGFGDVVYLTKDTEYHVLCND